MRKFGFIKIINNKLLKNNDHLKNLGPEPLAKILITITLKNISINEREI